MTEEKDEHDISHFEEGPTDWHEEQERVYEEGYERGRADMRKELLGDGKPEVWIPHHKEYGWQFSAYASSKVVAKMALTEAIKDNGWQIKPVKIIEVEE